MNRRKLLQDLIYGGTATWLATQTAVAQNVIIPGITSTTPFLGDPALARAEVFAVKPSVNPAAVFTLGAAAGDPASDGIVLWTRVAPQAIVSGVLPVVGWEIATDRNFNGSQVLRGAVSLSSSNDYTAKVPIRHVVLKPFTTYYYRFLFNGTPSRVCRFKTLPVPGSFLGQLRLAYISCQDYTNGYYNALAHLAQEEIDYVVHLGDYIYESIGDPAFQGGQIRPIATLPSGGRVAASLDDYRSLYRTYRSDPNLQAVHERFAFIQIWDDHEFQNDAWRDQFPDNNPNPALPQPNLRKQASQAWAEYIPANVSFNALGTPLTSISLYRSFTFGDLMELVATDERLYRDGPPCGYERSSRAAAPTCAERERATRTMLGDTQRDWFVNKIRDSRATWKVWANEVMAMQFRLLNSGPNSRYVTLDQWDGYPAERSQLFSRIAGTKNFVAITGDIHSFAAGYLRPDFEQWFSTPVGVEFVGGSITSANLSEVINSNVPLPSEPVSGPSIDIPASAIEAIVRLNNWHIDFFNSSTHGYVIVDLNHLWLSCTMKQVSTVREPVATSSVLQSFIVFRDVPFLFRQ